ncbi:MAG: SDR family NAD(P)-dependent oxidoreductase [Pseudomonadota bacterium]
MKIENKTAIITGGASGLGEATVRRFRDQGARIAIFDMNDQRGGDLASELGDQVKYYNVNVSDAESVEAAVDDVSKTFGDIHVLCNYAGISIPTKTINKDGPGDLDLFIKVINVNLVGTFNVSRVVAYAMSQQETVTDCGCRGVIIHTSSVAGYEGQIGQAAYSASKAGVVGMTLTMARDLARNGVRVNSIVPGLIHTPMFDQLPEDIYNSLVGQVNFPQRLGRPEEIAHLAQYIVENDYTNGESIRMDGAIRMQAR